MLNSNLTWQHIYFSPKGRVNRATYWIYALPFFAGYLLAEYLITHHPDRAHIGWMLYIAMAYPGIMIQIKRWHDRNKSGWWVLINLFPLIGALWALIENGFLRGDERMNDYGVPPEDVGHDAVIETGK